MIDFNYIINFIKNEWKFILILLIIGVIIYFGWDTIVYHYEVEQGKRNFYHQYYK